MIEKLWFKMRAMWPWCREFSLSDLYSKGQFRLTMRREAKWIAFESAPIRKGYSPVYRGKVWRSVLVHFVSTDLEILDLNDTHIESGAKRIVIQEKEVWIYFRDDRLQVVPLWQFRAVIGN